MKKLLSGDEALAQGAFQAGVRVATAYPGTPSTEILETLARYPDVYCEWSTNEKVAMEVAVGASLAGVRTMVSMKHVGLNVASDPFFGASMIGVKGGLVVVSADDPGMHSSQDEQDNRHYAKFVKVPMLEPSDSQEAYDLIKEAFSLSEEFDTPVLLRITTRVAHGKSVVEVADEAKLPSARPTFHRDRAKYVTVPGYARVRHRAVEERLQRLAAQSETFPYNRIIAGDSRLGVVSSGVAFHYAREVFPQASVLKLAMTYPLPKGLLRRFASSVDSLIVVEELDPFLEEAIQALGLEVRGKELFPLTGELNIEIVEEGARRIGLLPPAPVEEDAVTALPPRPPRLCPGCPHVAASYTLKQLGLAKSTGMASEGEQTNLPRPPSLIVTGDIGCYTLAVYQPFMTLDTSICMGASIGMALGLEKAGVPNKVVAVIGDSTFVHSGITPLINLVYNQGHITVVILDNGTTAMTGHQGHPGMGVNARGEKTARVCLEDLCRGIGVRDVHVVNAFDMAQIDSTIRASMDLEEPSVVIVRGDCPLNVRVTPAPRMVRQELCDGCNNCLRVGCPALARAGGKVSIDPTLCVGGNCDVCAQLCPQQAIVPLKLFEALS